MKRSGPFKENIRTFSLKRPDLFPKTYGRFLSSILLLGTQKHPEH
jgi:hypothetical protein